MIKSCSFRHAYNDHRRHYPLAVLQPTFPTLNGAHGLARHRQSTIPGVASVAVSHHSVWLRLSESLVDGFNFPYARRRTRYSSFSRGVPGALSGESRSGNY